MGENSLKNVAHWTFLSAFAVVGVFYIAALLILVFGGIGFLAWCAFHWTQCQ